MSLGRHSIVLILSALAVMAGAPNCASATSATFSLYPSTPVLACLGTAPTVTATLTPGNISDMLKLTLSGFKPKLGFDMFTIQNSNQLANGSSDPNFKNFGLAWYQSDIPVNGAGTATVTIKTILADQIFGFDPAVSLTPTNTFHVGFWFNNPKDAQSCGFTGTTPFNGEHAAGPLAFITRPNATTGLGPLCLHPSNSSPSGCDQ